MFIIKLNKSVLVTYVGIICGVASMYFAFSKMVYSDICYLRYSLVFLILAGVCDMFDGKVARMCKRTAQEKEFGIQLDSLADTVCFICVPVVIMLSLGMTSLIDYIIYSLFVITGVSRLGFFNTIATADKPVPFYYGVPVTTTAIFYPIFGLLHGVVPENIFKVIYLILTLLFAFFFVYKIKVPKLKGKFYLIIPILAIILSILLLVIK